MIEHVIDKRIFELKQEIKKAKQLKRMMKQKERLENALYKSPVRVSFHRFVDDAFFTIKEIINKGEPK